MCLHFKSDVHACNSYLIVIKKYMLIVLLYIYLTFVSLLFCLKDTELQRLGRSLPTYTDEDRITALSTTQSKSSSSSSESSSSATVPPNICLISFFVEKELEGVTPLSLLRNAFIDCAYVTRSVSVELSGKY